MPKIMDFYLPMLFKKYTPDGKILLPALVCGNIKHT
jgi:hypothetical protein